MLFNDVSIEVQEVLEVDRCINQGSIILHILCTLQKRGGVSWTSPDFLLGVVFLHSKQDIKGRDFDELSSMELLQNWAGPYETNWGWVQLYVFFLF